MILMYHDVLTEKQWPSLPALVYCESIPELHTMLHKRIIDIVTEFSHRLALWRKYRDIVAAEMLPFIPKKSYTKGAVMCSVAVYFKTNTLSNHRLPLSWSWRHSCSCCCSHTSVYLREHEIKAEIWINGSLSQHARVRYLLSRPRGATMSTGYYLKHN